MEMIPGPGHGTGQPTLAQGNLTIRLIACEYNGNKNGFRSETDSTVEQRWPTFPIPSSNCDARPDR